MKEDLCISIAKDYLAGMKYIDIEKKYNVNQGNIQQALWKIGVKTNRIKSKPRLLFNYKKKPKINKYYDYFNRNEGDYPNQKIKNNNPVHLLDDLDIMERMDEANDFIDKQFYWIEVMEDGKVRYVKGG